MAFFNLGGLDRGPAVTTAVRLYLHGAGGWAADVTLGCDWCGHRSPVSTATLAAVQAWERVTPVGGPPCLSVPAEAFHDDRLRTSCPHCGGELRVNPFVVDGAREVGRE